ncbi:hypothetical protein [Halorarum halobium]|uniref:hypothetical protein n=1 Tax=Halorarum halobium TaxID=3075121 RepID=UPI0028ABA413|nr:hypothetical protein [Halobaculum sp. XH14]
MSARSLPLLPLLLAGLLVASGTAFGLTFAAQLEWQERDAVSATVTDLTVSNSSEDGPAVRGSLSVENPLDRRVQVNGVRLLVFDGPKPPDQEDRLSVPRSASIDRVTVSAGETVSVRVRADVRPGDADRLRAALEDGTANTQGLLELTMIEKPFTVDVE